MNRDERLQWLTETDGDRLETLWRMADDTRRENVGDAVHLRALVEFSNRCDRSCLYCGIRRGHAGLHRYQMTIEEILDCAREAGELGLGTVVLQSGEDHGMPAQWLADVIERIKTQTALAVTLSVGERDAADYALWRKVGADRFLLRFETSNPKLYDWLHPGAVGGIEGRLATLEVLRELEYEVGSGVMVGIPGQTVEDLADDLALIEDLQLHMIGLGPFIAHPDTPLGRIKRAPVDGQVAPNELNGAKMLALARMARPATNIPATTALATLNPTGGRVHGLQRGGNVVMPNLTPARYKALYEIYPGKAGVTVPAAESVADVKHTLAAMGRPVGAGRGDSPAYLAPTGARP